MNSMETLAVKYLYMLAVISYSCYKIKQLVILVDQSNLNNMSDSQSRKLKL